MPQKACERYVFHVMAYAIFSKCIWENGEMHLGKWGISKKMNIKKWGILRKMHVINFKRENEPKMKWGISKKIA